MVMRDGVGALQDILAPRQRRRPREDEDEGRQDRQEPRGRGRGLRPAAEAGGSGHR